MEIDMDIDEFVDTAIRANDLVYLAKMRDEILGRGGARHDWENRVMDFFDEEIPGEEIATPAEMDYLKERIAAVIEKTL